MRAIRSGLPPVIRWAAATVWGVAVAPKCAVIIKPVDSGSSGCIVKRRVDGLSTRGSLSGPPARRVWVVRMRCTAGRRQSSSDELQPADRHRIGEVHIVDADQCGPGPAGFEQMHEALIRVDRIVSGVPVTEEDASQRVPCRLRSVRTDGACSRSSTRTPGAPRRTVSLTRRCRTGRRPIRSPRSLPILTLALRSAVLPVPGRPSITIGLPRCSQVPDST